MRSFPQNNDYLPGTWKGIRKNDQVTRTAAFTCPDCGRACSLTNHTIADDGMVSPSLVCPHEGCSFHEFIQLEGWQDASKT